jgi:hypothetical protein
MNSQGEIVGAYRNFPTGDHGFVLSNGVLRIIDAPGPSTRFQGNATTGINPAGDMITGGFLMSRGVFTSIEIPGALFTDPIGINARGDIVGFYGDSTAYHGFCLTK